MLCNVRAVNTTMLSVQTSEIPAISRTLARAFADDPVFEVLFGGAVPEVPATRFFTIMARAQFDHGLVFRTPGNEAAAIWAPPGKWKLPVSQIVKNAPGFVRVFGHRMISNLGLLNRLEKAHPQEPHYYLEFIGTDPAFQGKGMGTQLMQPMIDRCDQEGIGAYLESSKEANLAFYGRFGFEVTRVLTHKAARGGSGPQQWLMWRNPR
ncbi:MAG: putative GCN5-related N-acetyltransferase [Ilumatobacteraceae bacterium]|nr:putative GCN5-related N-acetyltransferase [Ilumatobacteraceae bacterium]